jgi:SAM-dependent methyltransferase
MMNLSAVEAATPAVLARGIKVFNGALFGADEQEHVDVLLEVLAPAPNAMLIDAGCGVGEMARLMCERRPDLEFLLVNLSPAQLELCPPSFHRLIADFDKLTGVPDGSADAIIFSFAICHSADWPKTLAEARRVLKTGGTLLINDMARLAGDNVRFEEVLGARVHEPEAIEEWARAAGFQLDVAIAPGVQVDRMAELLAADGLGADLVADVIPTIWRFTALSPEDAAWARHVGRIAFQFSGGRDSTAALYVLRERWPQMAVYHLDTGDQFPETRAVVAQVEADLLRAGVVLQRIVSDVKQVRETHGYPVDLVPVDNTDFGRLVSGESLKLTGRYECCARSLMAPMHARMIEDGITLIVRAQRDD